MEGNRVAIIAVVIALAFGMFIGTRMQTLTQATKFEAMRSEMDGYRAQIADLRAQLVKAQAAPVQEQIAAQEPPQDAPAPKEWSDGMYLVGEDIEPGLYRGTPAPDGGAYWARLKDADPHAIISNGTPDGPFVLRIKKSDFAVEINDATIRRK